MRTWKLTARDLCRKPDMVIPDVPLPTGPLGMQVILYPKMKVRKMISGGYSLAAVNHYHFVMGRDTGFVAVNGVPAAPYPSEPNTIAYKNQVDYLASSGAIGFTVDDGASNMDVDNMSFTIPWVAGKGKMLVFSTLRNVSGLGSQRMLVLEDSQGNRAFTAPFIVLDANYNVLQDYICPELKVELVSSTISIAKLRLTRSYPVPANAEFASSISNWILPAGILTSYADPLDAMNADKLIVECAAGKYLFQVSAVPQSGVTNYPASLITSLVEVK